MIFVQKVAGWSLTGTKYLFDIFRHIPTYLNLLNAISRMRWFRVYRRYYVRIEVNNCDTYLISVTHGTATRFNDISVIQLCVEI